MFLLDFLFPKRCLGCKREGKYICDLCLSKVQRARPIYLGPKSKSSLNGLVSIFRYEGVVKKAILTMKYRFSFDIASELAEAVVQQLLERRKTLPRNPILTVVPMHDLRKNWRGFNQSEEIGKLIAKRMGWRFIPDLLVKKVNTVPQVDLKRVERMQNIKGVLSFNPSYKQSALPHCAIIFDDVFTTGATINEACRVIKEKGVKRVWGITVAR
jgi:ComF family protein